MSGRRDAVALGVLLLVGLALRLTAVGAPPFDAHHVRQADTASMARVMFREGIDLGTPRIAWAGPHAGPVEAEFPLYTGLVALGWRELGAPATSVPSASLAWARGVSVGAWLLGALALLAWVRRRLPGPAWPFLVLYSLAPLSVVFTRNIQPDALAVALLLVGLDRLDAAGERGRAGGLEAGLAGVVLGVALAVKPTVGFWLIAAVPCAAAAGLRSPRFGRVLVASGVALSVGAAWFLHATSLAADGATFGIWGPDAHKWGGPAQWGAWNSWAAVAVPFLAATATPIGVVAAGLGGLRLARRPETRGFSVGLLAVVPAVVVATEGFALHAYYQLPAVPFVSVCAGWTLREALRLYPRVPADLRVSSAALVAAGVALVASVWLGVGYVRAGLRLDPRPAAVARQVLPHLEAEASVAVVGPHPQTVLYALDRRGWVRTPEAAGGWERLGADYVLWVDVEGEVQGTSVARGPGWRLYAP